jgi:hypothetical protein
LNHDLSGIKLTLVNPARCDKLVNNHQEMCNPSAFAPVVPLAILYICAERVSLEQLAKLCDILIVCASLNESRKLIIDWQT